MRAAAIGGDVAITADEVARGLSEWRQAVDRACDYDEVVLWFEHDVFDQLNLIQLLDRLRHVQHPRATMIAIDTFPGRPDFHGLGELTPEELGSLWPSRVPITRQQYDLASRAWNAFRSSDAGALPRFLDSDTSALPFLARALRRFLEEFPAPGDGLSRTERRLLRLVADGPRRLRAIFPRMHDDEDAFYIADVSLWDRVHELATTTPPLVKVDPPDRAPARLDAGLPDVQVSITPAGLDVLQGRANRVQLCGFDRWLGGVHVVHRRGG